MSADRPTHGVGFTEEEVRSILATVDSPRPLELKYVEETKLGYNNKVSFIETTDRQRLVLKVGGKFWHRQKTEAEVAGLLMAPRALPSVRVPQVIGFSSELDRAGKVGKHEWILLERVPGEPLPTAWETLSDTSKKAVTKELSRILIEIATCDTRHCITKESDEKNPQIGNLSLTPPSQDKTGKGYNHSSYPLKNNRSPIYISNMLSVPRLCSSYSEYVAVQFATELNALEGVALKRSEMTPQKNRLPRLRRMSKEIHKLRTVREIDEDPRWRPVYTHGDFRPPNILLATDSKNDIQLTILDWEWCGYFPPHIEWTNGISELLEFLREDAALGLESIVLEALESANLMTPRNGGSLWEDSLKINRVIELINPYWLPSYAPEDADDEVKKGVWEKCEAEAKELDHLLDYLGAPVP